MVTIVKHEWHQVDVQYAIEIDEALLAEIYPDLDEDEISELLIQIETGHKDVEELVDDAHDNDVDLEWDHQYDDNWTMRKGGYDVTYELGDESSWVTPDTPPEPTHKCTKCKWKGQGYDAEWQWEDSEGNSYDEAKKVCPMCDSDLELTEHGEQEDQARMERLADLEKMLEDDEESPGEVLAVEPPDQIPQKWPFDNPVLDNIDDEDDGSLKNFYPAGEYTIRIWGRTREIGVHEISKEQYEYWSDEDHEDDLSDALNESFDYDDAETPEEARFEYAYYEYQDTVSFWGFDEDDTHMTIEDSEGNTIYEGDLISFVDAAHGEEDSRWEITEEVKELYPDNMDKPGYYLFWTQGGKGSCIQTTVVIEEGQEFVPQKLGYTTWDVQGNSIVNRLRYDGVELHDEGMDSDHDNWRGQWSDFSVHETP